MKWMNWLHDQDLKERFNNQRKLWRNVKEYANWDWTTIPIRIITDREAITSLVKLADLMHEFLWGNGTAK